MSKIYKTALALLAILTLVAINGSVEAHPPAQEGTEDTSPPTINVDVSPLLHYQGRLTDPGTGDPVSDGSYAMTLRLYNVATGGSALWTETKDVSVQDGLFSTTLGDVTALNTSFFNGQALWLGIKVETDNEATPRQPLLPVAYALGLAPAAQISGANIASGTVADARISGSIARDSEVAAAYISNTGSGTITANNASPVLSLDQRGSGHGLQATLDGSTYTPPYKAAIIGRAEDGYGVAGRSDSSSGVYGRSETEDAVRGESWGTDNGGAGVFGGNWGGGPGGYFYGSSGTAIYASGDVEVRDNVIADKVLYNNPRVHYYTVGPEAFIPDTNTPDYDISYSNDGAYITSGFGILAAPVQLPDGAVVTQMRAYFYDNSSNSLSVYMNRNSLTSGSATTMASVSTSTSSGYYSVTDSSITGGTIDNANNSYFVHVYSASWAGTNLRIKGVRITYTISEAP